MPMRRDALLVSFALFAHQGVDERTDDGLPDIEKRIDNDPPGLGDDLFGFDDNELGFDEDAARSAVSN